MPYWIGYFAGFEAALITNLNSDTSLYCNRLASIFIFFLIFTNCGNDKAVFEKLFPEDSGIIFENIIVESSDFNILTYEYIYNGAGIAAADFNQNGYIDLYFIGNMSQNRLYLNEGDFKFRDVTLESGIGGWDEKWYSGVAVVDINSNGLPDIYLSATGREDSELRKNELYINQGLNEKGVPIFVEMAAAYGLDNTSFSTQAYFFDSNNNGILDLYLLVAHSASSSSYANIASQRNTNTGENRDRLFKGFFDDDLGHPVYREVSAEAGINKDGYGLGVNILDINGNGFKDIYVANDYISDDLFWINNGDGTFTDRAAEIFKHYSFSAMGTDAADLNNNGYLDIFTLDMLPEINVRRKMMANPNNYRNYVNNAFEGHHPQYTRNTLQMNMGGVDSIGIPQFSEVSLLAGVAETDWSWAPLLADLDNDGYRDILVTNGIPRDVTDKDFWDEYGRVRGVMPISMALPLIPEVKIANYLFKNNGTETSGGGFVTFSNVTSEWIVDEPTYSTGAVYADLNNNGLLDLVISNINEPVSLYRNRLDETNKTSPTNWLKINLKGPEYNRMGLGTKIDLYFGNHHQTYEHTVYRGYLSSVDPRIHFGIGEITVIDSLVISWPVTITDTNAEQRVQKFSNLNANQFLSVDYSHACPKIKPPETKIEPAPLFKDVTVQKEITYRQVKNNFNDFHSQPLLPYKLSTHGTGIASADLNGNGLDDIFIGGTNGSQAVILYQQHDGTFFETIFNPQGEIEEFSFEDSSVLLFDANGNGLNDIYIVSGGVEHDAWSTGYQDRFYKNNGGGIFTWLPNAIPDQAISGSVVISADFNDNGKPDLFVGGRVTPGRYPEPVSSMILRNDSDLNEIRFTDITDEVAPVLRNFGVVNDAIWSDFKNSGKPGLVIASEWQPLRFLENRDQIFVDVTHETGISDYRGWWFSISETDITGNGYKDFIVGNLGVNSLFRTSKEEPVSIWFGDLTGDGFFEAIPTIYLYDNNGERKEYPFHNRDDLFRMMPGLGSRFPTNRDYGRATISDILTSEMAENAVRYSVTTFESSVFINKGDGTFELINLPLEAQAAPVMGIIAGNFTDSGYTDLLISGNLYGSDLQTGAQNALNGLLLRGNGTGYFRPIFSNRSGFSIPGEGREIIKVCSFDNVQLVAVLQHSGQLKLFENSEKSCL